jgi:hypothetical protein
MASMSNTKSNQESNEEPNPPISAPGRTGAEKRASTPRRDLGSENPGYVAFLKAFAE